MVLVFALLLSYWWWWLFLASIFFTLKKYDYKIKKIFIFLNLQDNYWTISFPPSQSLSQTWCTHTHSIPYKMNLENSLFWNSSKKISSTNSVILTSKLVMHTQICLVQGNLVFNGQICTNGIKIILTHSETEDIMRQLSENVKFKRRNTFLNWIYLYWGEIGQQNHTGLKCTTQKNTIYTLQLALSTHSQVSFHHYLSSLCPFPPPSHFSGYHQPYCCPCLCVIHMCVCVYTFLLNTFVFLPSPPTSLTSDSCQSVLCIYAYVSILFNYFVD